MRILITGAHGLIGWHAHARLHAANCAAAFQSENKPFDIVALSHANFEDNNMLYESLIGVDVVLHFAGVNRATHDNIVEAANPAIAARLIASCQAVGCVPHIIYANSTHAALDTPYGRSKRQAGEMLAAFSPRYTDLVLPHIFGEGARPFYNNVTATLIAKLLSCEQPDVNPDGQVQLLHAGTAAQSAIDAALSGHSGLLTPEPRPMSVPALLAKLQEFHQSYSANIYPNLHDPFDLALFNSYRAASYPDGWPRPLKLNRDVRGTLFEAVKGRSGGQIFLSTTLPGITRGNHFHLNKIERFLVVQGDAIIRIRKVLSDEVWEYHVSGGTPAPVDMPTLHTHSIENVGDSPLLTMFWTHDLFDPQNPDTFVDRVLH